MLFRSPATDDEVVRFVKDTFTPSDEEVSVSILADMLNALLLQKSGYKVSAVGLAKFYEDKGFLEVIVLDGKNVRTATKKGADLGIKSLDKINSKGEAYRGNFYNVSAQRYAAERIREVLGL